MKGCNGQLRNNVIRLRLQIIKSYVADCGTHTVYEANFLIYIQFFLGQTYTNFNYIKRLIRQVLVKLSIDFHLSFKID